MTIAKAFNEIAVAQGGTADTSGTIAGAIDAVNDALAGSDLPKKPRIEDGIRVLGEYIGGGGSSVGPLVHIYNADNENTADALYFYDADCTMPLISNGVLNFGPNDNYELASGLYIGFTTDWVILPVINGTEGAPLVRVNAIEWDGDTWSIYKIEALSDPENFFYKLLMD